MADAATHPNARADRTLLRGVRAPRRARRWSRATRPTRRSPIRCSTLDGAEVGAMWTMLCERGKDLAIEARDIAADDARRPRALGGAVHVLGDRPAGPQRDRRDVHISRRADRRTHVDAFDLWRWSRHGARAEGRAAGLDAARRRTRSARRRAEGARRVDGATARRCRAERRVELRPHA